MFISSLIDAAGEEGRKIFEKYSQLLKISGIETYLIEHHEHGIKGLKTGIKDTEKRLNTLEDFLRAVESLDVPENVKKLALEIIESIAQAEASVHSSKSSDVHFHELGNLDTLFDAVMVGALIEELSIKYVFSSPVAIGSGEVEIAHGRVSVPAPATLELLSGMPLCGGSLKGEVTTPTGAAILRALRAVFSFPDGFRFESAGYGFGHKQMEHPNYLRIMLGWISDEKFEQIFEVHTNIDDATPQAVGSMIGKLLDEGALDAWVEQIVMKKNRPAFKVCFLAEESKLNYLIEVILKNTPTIGVRFYPVMREKLERTVEEVETEYGKVRVKVAYRGSDFKVSAEFDDCLELADKFGLPVDLVKRKAEHECAMKIVERFKENR